jgi:hypothetical protein
MLGRETITVKRITGSFTNGIWSETTTSGTIHGSVQPLTSKQMETLPEGYRDSKGFTIYGDINETMLTSAEINSKTPDVVTIDNVDYQVIKALKHRALIKHYEYIVLKKGQ